MKGDYDEADDELAAAAQLDGSWAAEVERERTANRRRATAAASKQKRELKNFLQR
jgi:hypothetical protein